MIRNLTKLVFIGALVLPSCMLVSGCAALNSVSDATGLNYQNGEHISQQTLNRIKDDQMSQTEVVKLIGHPDAIHSVNGLTYWYYPFTDIRYLGGNTHVTNVIVFTNGYASDAY